MAIPSWDEEEEGDWDAPQTDTWYQEKARATTGNDIPQKYIKPGYDFTDTDLTILVEELEQYVTQQDLYDTIKDSPDQAQAVKRLRGPTTKAWLVATTCPRFKLRDIPEDFHLATAGRLWKMMLANIRRKNKIKTEDHGRSQTPKPSSTERGRSSSVLSSKSTASLTEQMGLATVKEKMSLNDVNVHIRDPINHTTVKTFPLRRCLDPAFLQKVEENGLEIKSHHLRYDALVAHLSTPKFRNWFTPDKSQIIDPMTLQAIEDDDDLLSVANSHLAARMLEGIAIECRDPTAEVQPRKVTFQQPDARSPSASPPVNPLGKRPRKRNEEEDDAANKRPKRTRGRLVTRQEREREQKAKEEEEEKARRAKEARDKEKAARKGGSSKNDSDASSDSDEEDDNDNDDDDDDEDDGVQTAADMAKAEKLRLEAFLNARTADALKHRAGLAMEHCALAEWQEAAEFWGLPIEQFKDGRSLVLPNPWGLKTEFTPYQLTEVYILYTKELSTDNGGIFANMMGMGKSRSILLLLIVGYVHFRNWIDVWGARASGDSTRHRAADDDDDKPCPTASERTFRCACELNPSMPGEPRLAPTLASGWGKAARAWCDEVLAMGILDSKWCNQDDPLALRFCFVDDWAPKGMGPPTDAEVREMMIDPSVQSHLAKYNENVAPRKYTKNRIEKEETVYWKLARKTPAIHAGATANRPAQSSGRFIVVSAFGTLQKRVLTKYNTMSVMIHRSVSKKGNKIIERAQLPIPGHVVVWGRIIFDEFHNCKSETTIMGSLYNTLRLNNRGYQWKAWAMSGTPMERGLHEILIFISLALVGLADKDGISNWDEPVGEPDKDGFVQYGTVDEVYLSINKKPDRGTRGKATINGLVMAKNWSSIITRARNGVDSVCDSDEFKKLMSVGVKIASRFMLRRTLMTQDPWGRKISGIKGDFATFFRPCRDPDFRTIIQQAEQECQDVLVREGTDMQDALETSIFSRAELQAIASYPSLATLKAKQYKNVGSTRTKKFIGKHIQLDFAKPDEGMFAEHLQELIKGSSKYDMVEQRCIAVQADTTLNPKWTPASSNQGASPARTDEPKEIPAKILIGSYKPIVQLITWLALRKKFGDDRVILMKGGMDKEEFDSALGRWRDPDGPFIIVASMAFAEAITLTEAATVIIMEPQDRQNTQDQFLFRVYRLGQLAEICVGLILYTPESDLEISVLSKQLMKTVSRDGLQNGEVAETVEGASIEWDCDEDVPLKLEGLT